MFAKAESSLNLSNMDMYIYSFSYVLLRLRLLSTLREQHLLLYKLKRKARPQKFKETGKEINISNLDINRVLTKKEHNEIRRGIQHT